MKRPQLTLGVTIVAAILALLLMQHRVGTLDAKIENLAASLERATTSSASADEIDEELTHEPQVNLRRAAEIEAHFSPSLQNKDIKAFAQALLEADEWLFEPADQELAEKALAAKTEALRVWVKSAVERLLALALGAAKGSESANHLREAGLIFGLYPQPETDERQKEMEILVTTINEATRRVDELRRLRYNQWAIARIEDGVRQFHENKKVSSDAVVNVCVNALRYIDPAYLDPTVTDLYQYLVQLTRESAGDAYFARIAKGLTDPDVGRRTPLDFDK